jgi:HSP20 family protein
MALLLDTFRDLERLNQAFGAAWPTLAWPGAGWRSWVSSWMPMDGYRKGDVFCIDIDLPGVDPETIDLTVDNNVLTVQAERRRVVGEDVDLVISERPYGAFRRQVFWATTSTRTRSRRATRPAC